MTTQYNEHKVLPFEGKFGKVPGHAINAAVIDGEPVTHVVVWNWDDVARMGLEVLVPVGNFTTHQQRVWPNCGEVKAVVLKSGRRIWAMSINAQHDGTKAFEAAPAVCKTPFRIVALCSRVVLAEVAGVSTWCYSKRTPEDAAKILDPWARDNVAFAARMAHLQCAQAAA